MDKIKLGWHKNRKSLEKVWFTGIRDLGNGLFEIKLIDTFGIDSILYSNLEDYFKNWGKEK